MHQIKERYYGYHDKIIEKRFESEYPLRRYVHRREYETVSGKVMGYAKVLDAGCGEGVLSVIMARKGCMVFGCDLSKPNVLAARKLVEKEGVSHKAFFFIADLENLPLKDNAFECLVSVQVLEHLPDFNRGLMELHRVTSGRAIISVPTCLNLCAMSLLGGDVFWMLTRRSIYAVPLGFLRVLANLFGEGVDEGYAGKEEFPHIWFYPWVFRRHLKRAGFRIDSYEAVSLAFPYLPYLFPPTMRVIAWLDGFRMWPLLRQLGYGSIADVHKKGALE